MSRMPDEPTPRKSAHAVALWAGLSAFFGNIIGLKVLEVISGNDIVQILSALLISAFVGGAVYSRERLAVARRDEPHDRGD